MRTPLLTCPPRGIFPAYLRCREGPQPRCRPPRRGGLGGSPPLHRFGAQVWECAWWRCLPWAGLQETLTFQKRMNPTSGGAHSHRCIQHATRPRVCRVIQSRGRKTAIRQASEALDSRSYSFSTAALHKLQKEKKKRWRPEVQNGSHWIRMEVRAGPRSPGGSGRQCLLAFSSFQRLPASPGLQPPLIFFCPPASSLTSDPPPSPKAPRGDI